MNAEEIEALRRIAHPERFGRHVTGLIPYSAQTVVMLCPHPFPLVFCGRGVGKSSILQAMRVAWLASTKPSLDALLYRHHKPIPMRFWAFGAVKEQAYSLQKQISDMFDMDPWLRSLKSDDSGKTNITLIDGTTIGIRAATHAARGPHAQVIPTKSGSVKGRIQILVDEAAYLREPDFVEEVLKPMLMVGGEGSQISMYSTPAGQQGEMWELWSGEHTGDCRQTYTVDANGRRKYQFDKSKCWGCIASNYAVRHNFPSSENPFADRRFLLKEKRKLCGSGRKETWLQEYCGIASETSGLFMNAEIQKIMWDDKLDQYRLDEDGNFVRLSVRAKGVFDTELVHYGMIDRDAEYWIGVDNNQGVESKRADYASVAVVMRKAGKAPLLLCERFLKPPEQFGGKHYKPGNLTPFMIDYVAFLIRMFDPRKVFIDQGAGQAIMVPLSQMDEFNENLFEYIPTSAQQKSRSMVHMRSMIEQGLSQFPAIPFLMKEVLYLRVDQDGLEDRVLKIDKAAAWGTMDKQVDGLFACAYAYRGTEGMEDSLYCDAVNQIIIPHASNSLITRVTRDSYGLGSQIIDPYSMRDRYVN
jgi:hypothetical protein